MFFRRQPDPYALHVTCRFDAGPFFFFFCKIFDDANRTRLNRTGFPGARLPPPPVSGTSRSVLGLGKRIDSGAGCAVPIGLTTWDESDASVGSTRDYGKKNLDVTHSLASPTRHATICFDTTVSAQQSV